VQTITVHQSKGLEYEYVFLPKSIPDTWPKREKARTVRLPTNTLSTASVLGDEKAKKLEEERRLYFVAVTRAKTGLFIMAPCSYGTKSDLLPSPFASETKIIEFPVGEIHTQPLLLRALQSSGTKATNEWENLQEEEIEYITEFLASYKISVSDLNKFLTNPLTFFRESVLKYPFEDNFATIFGSVYHKTLEDFFSDYLKTGTPPAQNVLLNSFKRYLSQQVLSPDERARMTEKGLKGLE